MSESSSNTIARERVDNLAAQNAEPDWLKTSRLAAWEAYLQTPMPTSRDEDWRKTRLSDLDLSKLIALDGNTQTEAQVTLPEWFQKAQMHFPTHAQVVGEVELGPYDVELSDDLKKKGVVCCSLKKALKEHEKLVRPYLETTSKETASGKFDKFELMAKALFNGGIFLHVPAGVEIKEPFLSVIDFHGTGELTKGKGAWAIFPRLIIVLGANAKVSLVNLFSAGTKEKQEHLSLFNGLIEIHIGEGATLNYIDSGRFSENVFAVTKTVTDVQRDGQLISLSAGVGGGQVKSEIDTALNGRGAASDVLGVVLGDKEEHFSFNTIQGHNAPDTRSNINFRVALKDRAASIYQGTIKVTKEAQKTDAFQSNKNLLLGSDARAESIPKLEILADDVKCSHGATVGPVDREQVFYLMSRGLTASKSEELIVTGFFREVIEQVNIEGVKEWLADIVRQKVQKEKR